MSNRMFQKIVVNTNHGKIVLMDDKMFGGTLYVVFHPNGDCIKKTISFNEAMSELKKLRLELKVF